MKKLVFLMCIGGFLALCTPLTGNEKSVDPPHTRHFTKFRKKPVVSRAETRAETPVAEQSESSSIDESEGNGGPEPAPGSGGVIVISGSALLLIIILLILFC